MNKPDNFIVRRGNHHNLSPGQTLLALVRGLFEPFDSMPRHDFRLKGSGRTLVRPIVTSVPVYVLVRFDHDHCFRSGSC